MKLSHPDCDKSSTGLEEEGLSRKSCFLITLMFASRGHVITSFKPWCPSNRMDSALGAEKNNKAVIPKYTRRTCIKGKKRWWTPCKAIGRVLSLEKSRNFPRRELKKHRHGGFWWKLHRSRLIPTVRASDSVTWSYCRYVNIYSLFWKNRYEKVQRNCCSTRNSQLLQTHSWWDNNNGYSC